MLTYCTTYHAMRWSRKAARYLRLFGFNKSLRETALCRFRHHPIESAARAAGIDRVSVQAEPNAVFLFGLG